MRDLFIKRSREKEKHTKVKQAINSKMDERDASPRLRYCSCDGKPYWKLERKRVLDNKYLYL